MATITDVAKRARVSTYTVSAVLNRSARVSPELTKRVLTAVQELDYTINEVARSLQTRRTQTIGMLIPDIANPFFAKVVRGVEDVCRGSNYSLLLGNTYDINLEQNRYLAVLRSKQVDGILLFAAPGGDEAALGKLIERKVPVVFAVRRPKTLRVDSVFSDNYLGTRLAVDHLIGRGHERIALITGPWSVSVSEERVEGWKHSLEKAGITPNMNLAREGSYTSESAHSHALELLNGKHPPTAFFTANFLMVTGILLAIKELGLACPEDVEVAGSDDYDWLDVFTPKITTVAHPTYELGVAAAELLLRRIDDPDKEPELVVLRPRLHIR